MPTHRIYAEQVEDVFVLKSVYNLAIINKANVDGSNTVGGNWYIDAIFSDLFPSYKQVLKVIGGQMAIEYGNVQLDTHRFIVTAINGLKVKVGANEHTIYHSGNLTNVSQLSNDAGYLDATDLDGFIYDVQYNATNHRITFYQQNEPNIVVDLPIESLIKNVQLVGNDLVFTFEDNTTVTVPLNTLLVGVVKSVNGKTPNSQGEIVLQVTDIPNLSSELANKLDIRMGGLVSNLTQAEKDAILLKLGVVNNVIQTLGLSGSTLTLSNGGGSVTLNIANINGLQNALDGKVSKSGDAMNGNLGIGVTPSAWGFRNVLQVGKGGSIAGSNDNNYPDNVEVSANVYLSPNGDNIYIQNNYAQRYRQERGNHIFYSAVSGTSGQIISWTELLSIDSNGNANLLGNLSIPNATANNHAVNLGQILGFNYITLSDVQTWVNAQNFAPITLLNSKVDKAGDAMTGNLGIGVTPSAWGFRNVLQVGKGGSIAGSNDNNYPDNVEVSANVYLSTNGADVYMQNNYAQRYRQERGKHIFYSAQSGNSGQVISWNELLSIDSNGNANLLGNLSIPNATANNHAVNLGQLSNYALLSNVYTQSQALGLFVGLNGVQTIADTKTFTSSPVIPNATLNAHAVNLGQLNSLLVGYATQNWVTSQGYQNATQVNQAINNAINNSSLNTWNGFAHVMQRIDATQQTFIDPKEYYTTIVHTRNQGVSGIQIDDHDTHGARLILRGTNGNGANYYDLTYYNDTGSFIGSVNIENGARELAWDDDVKGWIDVGF